MSRYSLVLMAALGWTSMASAASWAEALFDELGRDFGSVPRGPTLTHAFRLTNKTGQTVHVAGVRVSCGCVTAFATQTDLAPGEATSIQAQMDTRRFSGVKAVTIYVQFDQPRWEEVRLWVQANGRDDVTINPETLAFGQIKLGSGPAASANISFLGSNNWRIQEAQCDSNYVQATVQELRRAAGEVTYQVTAKLRPDVPAGKWYTDVWLKTNNPATPRVRVPLTVEIESALSVSPNVANLGEVKSGAEAARRVIIRGVKPFRITSVKGTDAEISVQDSSPESKSVHVLTIKLRADKPGEKNRTLHVITDLEDEGEVEFQAVGQVMP
jgi:hypothetical protein